MIGSAGKSPTQHSTRREGEREVRRADLWEPTENHGKSSTKAGIRAGHDKKRELKRRKEERENRKKSREKKTEKKKIERIVL